MTGEATQRPQEARTPSAGTKATPAPLTPGERLQAALDARSGDLRARAGGGGVAAALGCQPGCFVCAGEGGLRRAYLTAVTPTR